MVALPATQRALLQLMAERQLRDGDVASSWRWTASQVKELGRAAALEEHLALKADALKAEDKALLDRLEAMSREERWAFWQKELSRCMKCYACRSSCPMCYCEHCTMDCNRPQWVPVASHGLGNLEYHMVRTMHLAGRCVECGDCGRACPVGIPVHLLTYLRRGNRPRAVRPAGRATRRSWTTRSPPSGPTTKSPSSGRSPWQTHTNSPTNPWFGLFDAHPEGRQAHAGPGRFGRPRRAERGGRALRRWPRTTSRRSCPPRTWSSPRSSGCCPTPSPRARWTWRTPSPRPSPPWCSAIRPCEAKAFAALDAVFNWDYRDKFFNARIEKLAVIGVSCTRADEACFCTSVGGGPADPAGSDILLTPDRRRLPRRGAHRQGQGHPGPRPRGLRARQRRGQGHRHRPGASRPSTSRPSRRSCRALFEKRPLGEPVPALHRLRRLRLRVPHLRLLRHPGGGRSQEGRTAPLLGQLRLPHVHPACLRATTPARPRAPAGGSGSTTSSATTRSATTCWAAWAAASAPGPAPST